MLGLILKLDYSLPSLVGAMDSCLSLISFFLYAKLVFLSIIFSTYPLSLEFSRVVWVISLFSVA